jgi:RNA polymerase sigma factor (sigma-70 family)
MSSDPPFAEFIHRIRQGDEQAAAELVRRYEPAIRLEVRMRLRRNDPALRRAFDSMDVCQAVLASFFVRAAAGQYDLDEPAQLVRLLVAMARNKLGQQARRNHRQRRDVRRTAGGDETLTAPAREPGPERVVQGRELLQAFRERLTEEERRLADLRAEGHEWAAIAEQMGGTAQARRKQLARAADRVARELGLEETDP